MEGVLQPIGFIGKLRHVVMHRDWNVIPFHLVALPCVSAGAPFFSTFRLSFHMLPYGSSYLLEVLNLHI